MRGAGSDTFSTDSLVQDGGISLYGGQKSRPPRISQTLNQTTGLNVGFSQWFVNNKTVEMLKQLVEKLEFERPSLSGN